MRRIRRPQRPGALQALIPASRGPARFVIQLQLGSSLRHPILGTDRLGRRPAPHPAVTVHW